jgi:hypothetical protein
MAQLCSLELCLMVEQIRQKVVFGLRIDNKLQGQKCTIGQSLLFLFPALAHRHIGELTYDPGLHDIERQN